MYKKTVNVKAITSQDSLCGWRNTKCLVAASAAVARGLLCPAAGPFLGKINGLPLTLKQKGRLVARLF